MRAFDSFLSPSHGYFVAAIQIIFQPKALFLKRSTVSKLPQFNLRSRDNFIGCIYQACLNQSERAETLDGNIPCMLVFVLHTGPGFKSG